MLKPEGVDCSWLWWLANVRHTERGQMAVGKKNIEWRPDIAGAQHPNGTQHSWQRLKHTHTHTHTVKQTNNKNILMLFGLKYCMLGVGNESHAPPFCRLIRSVGHIHDEHSSNIWSGQINSTVLVKKLTLLVAFIYFFASWQWRLCCYFWCVLLGHTSGGQCNKFIQTQMKSFTTTVSDFFFLVCLF